MSTVDDGRRPEAAALDEHGLLAQHLARLQHLPVGAEHRDPRQAEPDELEGHQAVVDPAELDAAEGDEVDLDASGREPVEQAAHDLLGLLPLEEGGVQEVDADDAERLLLQRGVLVEHPDVDDDLAGLVAGLGLEAHAHPAVALVAAAVAAGHHRVGEGEEAGAVTAAVAEPLTFRSSSCSSIACRRPSDT
jgi:hypothetical protein